MVKNGGSVVVSFAPSAGHLLRTPTAAQLLDDVRVNPRIFKGIGFPAGSVSFPAQQVGQDGLVLAAPAVALDLVTDTGLAPPQFPGNLTPT